VSGIDDDSPRGLLRNLRELLALDVDGGIAFGERAMALPQADTSTAGQQAAAAPAAPPRQPPPSFSPDGSAAERLGRVAELVADCQRCGLCEGRTRTVPGEGAPEAELLFIGEGPGADEDRQGRPFVGAAGQLLNRMIAGMGFTREEVFIANVVKCRPPGNRNPEADEAAACRAFLDEQIRIIKPKVICTLGNIPLRALSGNDRLGITRARGKPFNYHGTTVIPTFHPSYLLRNEAAKKPCWDDLKQVLAALGRQPPGRG
jgi:DNA polymerase